MEIKKKTVVEATYAIEAVVGAFAIEANVVINEENAIGKISGGVVTQGEEIVARFSMWNSKQLQVTYLVETKAEQDAINAAIHEFKGGVN